MTLLLLAVCSGLLGWQLWPRLTVQRVPISFEQPELNVAISGAVAAPGFYTVPWGSRVGDLIDAAGGMTAAAEPTLVNLADPLTMGEGVSVPGALAEGGGARVSINTASERELDLLLPGVGPVTASKIVAGRPFAAVEDLLDVSGIGPATLEKLLPFVKP